MLLARVVVHYKAQVFWSAWSNKDYKKEVVAAEEDFAQNSLILFMCVNAGKLWQATIYKAKEKHRLE